MGTASCPDVSVRSKLGGSFVEIAALGRVSAFAAVSLALSACGSGTDTRDLLSELETIADDACNCRDRHCAERIRARVHLAASSSETMDDRVIAGARTAVARINGCMKQASAVKPRSDAQ